MDFFLFQFFFRSRSVEKKKMDARSRMSVMTEKNRSRLLSAWMTEGLGLPYYGRKRERTGEKDILSPLFILEGR